MPDSTDTTLQGKISERLRFYEDLGLSPFYRDRRSPKKQLFTFSVESSSTATEEPILPKAATKATAVPNIDSKPVLPVATGPSLFGAAGKIPGETLLRVRQDLGECTRCKLHQTRNKIVFGDGSAKAQLVFVGEGPGADEDAQGLPFVGRAGKLLTQMIEAMGLQRDDVYICNVVKCRPPENRKPEDDEVATCSPYLYRQLDVIAPKAIVCLGGVAAQTLLKTKDPISRFRGNWYDFRNTKLLPTYHPAYLLRNPAAKSEVWKDLQKVMAHLGLKAKKTSR